MPEEKLMNRFGLCERCGAFVEPGARFCDACAKAVRDGAPENEPVDAQSQSSSFAVCGRCGTVIRPGETYCDVCRRVVEMESCQLAAQPQTSNLPDAAHPSRQNSSRQLLLGAEDDASGGGPAGMPLPTEFEMRQMEEEDEKQAARRLSPIKIIAVVVIVAAIVFCFVRFGFSNVFEFIAWGIGILFLRFFGLWDDYDDGYGYGGFGYGYRRNQGSFLGTIIMIVAMIALIIYIQHLR